MLSEIQGVEKVDVDFAQKTATVTVKKGTDTTAVAAALSGRYSGKLKE